MKFAKNLLFVLAIMLSACSVFAATETPAEAPAEVSVTVEQPAAPAPEPEVATPEAATPANEEDFFKDIMEDISDEDQGESK